MKFLSSAILLSSNQILAVLVKGLPPILGLTIAASFLYPLVTSSLAAITSSIIVFCGFYGCQCYSLCYNSLFSCHFSLCLSAFVETFFAFLTCFADTVFFEPAYCWTMHICLIETYFWHNDILLALVKITLTDAYIHIHCLHLCYYKICLDITYICVIYTMVVHSGGLYTGCWLLHVYYLWLVTDVQYLHYSSCMYIQTNICNNYYT